MNKSHLDLSISGESNKSPKLIKNKKYRASRKVPYDSYEISKNLIDFIIENSMY
jgi:hypothetical protein